MRRSLRSIAIALFSAAVAPSAFAATLHVPSQYPTIASALGAAASGDVVQVACGTYLEQDLGVPSGVTLRGSTATPWCVVIDAQGMGRVITCELASQPITIEGVTLANGHALGITFGRPSGPEDMDEDAYLDALVDEAERATGPTGVSPDNGGGAGAYCFASHVTFRDCIIRDCTTSASGAGIRSRYSTLNVIRCRFERNFAQNQGGGLCLEQGSNSSIDDCSFALNEARVGGGAIVLGSSNVGIEGSFFTQNRADRFQGGSGGALAGVTSALRIEECTLVANHAKLRGNAVYLGGTSSLLFDRAIAAFGTGGTGGAFSRTGAGSGTAHCSDSYSNSGGDFTGPLNGQGGIEGNFSTDPLICSLSDPEVGLSQSSPCLPANNACGVIVGATANVCSMTGVVVTTIPAGLSITVDGATGLSPRFFDWEDGSVHSIGTTSPQTIGPQTRAEFDSWSDGGAIAHTIVHSSDVSSYVATFDLSHFVTMTSAPEGTVTPPSGWFIAGSTVTIEGTATHPDYGWGAWTGIGDGSYTGTDNPASITVLGPITQSASFAYTGEVTLTMTSAPGEGGTTTPVNGSYPQGTVVPISATANPNYVFSHWVGNGDGSYDGTDNPAVVTMNANITQTAHFTYLGPYTLSMSAIPFVGGTVTPGNGSYPQGTVVPIGATPNPYYVFSNWAGSGAGSYSGTNNPATVTMNANISQIANFVLQQFPLTMIAGPGGSVTPPSGNRNALSNVTITAIPGAGHSFVGWTGIGSGSYTGTQNPTSITMLGPITQTATFQANTYHLNMVAGPGGSVTPPSGDYLYGTPVTITAVPDSGFVFLAWAGNGIGSYSGQNNPATITIGGNITQTAAFGGPQLSTVTTLPPGLPITVDGASYVSPATFNWGIGTVHTVAVDSLVSSVPGDRHRYTWWSDGLPRVHSITVPPTPLLVFANFVREYQLAMVDPPEGTSIPGTSWHAPGSTVSIRGRGNPGFVFDAWTGEGNGSYSGTDNPVVVTLNGPLTQTSAFRPFGCEFSISASATDPFVNVSSPTGSAREIHFWLTCAEEGLSALQARTVGNLLPIAFAPADGVFNVGTATDVLLAVAGCPTGSQTAVRLGAWTVIDNGGTLCIDGASPTLPFTAVECDMIEPSIVVNPKLIGFTSQGGDPCVIDDNPCHGDVLALVERGGAPAAETATAAAAAIDAIEGSRPNPFRESTEIRFSIANAQNVSLTIYDVSGRMVRSLLDGQVGTGSHATTWDGRDQRGQRVPSGVFFVRLQTGKADETMKIVRLATP